MNTRRRSNDCVRGALRAPPEGHSSTIDGNHRDPVLLKQRAPHASRDIRNRSRILGFLVTTPKLPEPDLPDQVSKRATILHAQEKAKALTRVSVGQGPFRAGGRYWDRTSDLFRVREARYRCANRPFVGLLEVETGFEPVYTALQAVASPLGHSTVAVPDLRQQPRGLRRGMKPPSGQPGSNRRPQPWQGCALPTELCPRGRQRPNYPLCVRADINRSEGSESNWLLVEPRPPRPGPASRASRGLVGAARRPRPLSQTANRAGAHPFLHRGDGVLPHCAARFRPGV